MPPLITLLVLDERLRKRRTATAVALFAVIIMVGSIPGARAELGNLASGIVLHSIAYSVLTFLLFTGYAGNRTQRAIKAVLTVAAMGAVDELVQGLLAYRRGTVLDWTVDCSAALVTSLLLWMFLPQPVTAAATLDNA